MRSLFIALVLSIWSGFTCASAQNTESQTSPAFHAPAKGSDIIVMPVQLSDSRFGGGENPIEQEIIRQLTAAGFRPVRFEGSNLEAYWPEIIRQVRATTDPNDRADKSLAHAGAVGTLAKVATRDARVALVLSPVVITRVVDFSGDVARWDGVKRSPFANKDGYRLWNFRWKGTAMALSLEILAFGADGQWSFTTFGGITLPGEANVNTGQVTIREDLFKDQEELAEGVAIALRPLVER